MNMQADVIIVGTGVAGLFCALNIPEDKNVLMFTKSTVEESDSFLAQGGIAVLRDDNDYDSYYEDTMRAGHYENNPESVDIMIRSSRSIINELIGYGVNFTKSGNELVYTREGAHTTPRILYHEDITGKEITSRLLDEAKKRSNIKITEQFTMLDIIENDGECIGIVGKDKDGKLTCVTADYTVFATGGIGGLYPHSTNYPHLTGDAVAISIKHGIELLNPDYVQIHPTTFYTTKNERSFLISESVRGEGAVLLNKNNERFVDELLPRDVVTAAIYEQMEKDNMPYVRLSMKPISEEKIKAHFPNIYKRCLEEGYDVTKECIPVVPAQHYYMGGIKVDKNSKTTMNRLYAVGETACNGVHGKNRLASNSLLESLVFAKRAAREIEDTYFAIAKDIEIKLEDYENCDKNYGELVRKAIGRN